MSTLEQTQQRVITRLLEYNMEHIFKKKVYHLHAYEYVVAAPMMVQAAGIIFCNVKAESRTARWAAFYI